MLTWDFNLDQNDLCSAKEQNFRRANTSILTIFSEGCNKTIWGG